jgi:tRNA G10  N-methylase Trm11
MQSLFILGRQPALGLAELEALYGADAVKPISPQAAIVDVEPTDVDFDRLGGSTRFGRVLTTLKTNSWQDVEKFLIRECPKHAADLPEGKMTLGISAYGFKVSPAAVQATALSVKKAIKKSGRSVRIVPNKETELGTAQVLHNSLTSGNGWELFLVRNGESTVMAQTVQVQDIESYTVRDRERPMRDARVGMLPPKLAQMLINLSVGHLPPPSLTSEDYLDEETDKSETAEKPVRPTVLDPFCGTGVVLQEALLTGYGAYGTDIEPRMVEYTQKNVDWLKTAFAFENLDAVIEVGDATKHTWAHPFTHVACETYLGRPFTSAPKPEILGQTVSECNLIIKKFLNNIAGQMPSGTRLCLAVPAWQVRKGQFKHLPLLDSLEELGYNRISFEHAKASELLYYRPDQVVARELLVLEKK